MEPVVAKALGRVIRHARKQRNMKAATLAEFVGVQPQAVSFWETGKAVPVIANLLAVAEVLGVRASRLLAAAEVTIDAGAIFAAGVRKVSEDDDEG